MAPFDPDTYRSRAEQCTGELEAEYYRHFAGLKDECDLTSVYARYADLFSKEAVDTLTDLYRVADGDEKRRFSYLLNFAIDGFMGEQSKELGDEIANLEGRATIRVDGEEIGYRHSSVVLSNESDRQRRRRIDEARREVVRRQLNPRYDELWLLLHGLAGELGQPHYCELYADVRAVDFGMLRAAGDSFLHDTEGVYQRTLDRLVQRTMGFGLDELHYADFPYLIRASEYDHVFSSERLLPTFERLLADMGIDLAAQTNVHVDAEARDNKSPRAFCAPVRVPDEIYLVIMPHGGQDDLQALLHEGGHTEHLSHTPRELAFEYRHLGDNAVTEAFAFLFDHLMLNPVWLETYLDFSDSADFLVFANVVELYFLRRYAGKLAYETELHVANGPLDAFAGRYSRLLSQAVLVEVPPDTYLADVDAGFYCSCYLRAWMLEAALRLLLQDTYGVDWFRNTEAGQHLKRMWAHGQQYSADQLLLKYGGGKLDMGPLKRHLERALGR